MQLLYPSRMSRSCCTQAAVAYAAVLPKQDVTQLLYPSSCRGCSCCTRAGRNRGCVGRKTFRPKRVGLVPTVLTGRPTRTSPASTASEDAHQGSAFPVLTRAPIRTESGTKYRSQSGWEPS